MAMFERPTFWHRVWKWVKSFKTSTESPPIPWDDYIDEAAGLEIPQTAALIGSKVRGDRIAISCMVASSYEDIYMGSSEEHVWTWEKCNCFGSFHALSGPVYAIVISNATVVVCTHDGAIRLWEKKQHRSLDFEHYTTLRPLRTGKDVIIDRLQKWGLNFSRFCSGAPVTCVCVSWDAKFIYSGSTDNAISIWRVQDSMLIGSMRRHTQTVNAVKAGLGQAVFSGSEDGSIIMCLRQDEVIGDMETTTHTFTQYLKESGTSCVKALLLKCTVAGMNELFAAVGDGSVMVWKEASAWGQPEILSRHTQAVTCLAMSSGFLVFSGSNDGKICAWRKDEESGLHVPVMELRGHGGPINCIAVCDDWEGNNNNAPDPCILYSSCADKTLKVWRIII